MSILNESTPDPAPLTEQERKIQQSKRILGVGALLFLLLLLIGLASGGDNSGYNARIHQEVIDARQERAYDKLQRGERLSDTDVYDLAAEP